MIIRQPVPLLIAIFASYSSASHATDPEMLQARDLDGDPVTVEAYYDPFRNLTWLADANLGLTETFGLVRGMITDFGSQINEQGLMLREALPEYMSGMNQNQYLGYESWRLPKYRGAEFRDPDCSVQVDNGAITWGTGCSAPEIASFNKEMTLTYGSVQNWPFQNLDTSRHWLDSSGPAGRHHYQFGEDEFLSFCGAGRCNPGLIWPVHDGDIGVPAGADCVDTDGDGWGWDGYRSCRITVVETECVDSEPLGDGWGWNGIDSCRIEIENAACIDYPPVGDGWGWDGSASCRLAIAQPVCEDRGGYPWGWNPVTLTSCRLDEDNTQNIINLINDQRVIWNTHNTGTYLFRYSALPIGLTGENGCPVADVLPDVDIRVDNNQVASVHTSFGGAIGPVLRAYPTIDTVFDWMIRDAETISATPAFAAINGSPANYKVTGMDENCPDGGWEYRIMLCGDGSYDRCRII